MSSNLRSTWLGEEKTNEKTHEDSMSGNRSSKEVGAELLQEDLEDLKLEAGEDRDESEDVVGGKRLKNVLLSGEEDGPFLACNGDDGEDCRRKERKKPCEISEIGGTTRLSNRETNCFDESKRLLCSFQSARNKKISIGLVFRVVLERLVLTVPEE